MVALDIPNESRTTRIEPPPLGQFDLHIPYRPVRLEIANMPTATTPTTACSCDCHTSLYADCSVLGGCGSEGCDQSDRCCIAGARCCEYDRARQRAALLADPDCPLCPDCLRVAERDVRQLPYDYVDLEQLVPPSLGEWSDGQPKRGKGELPLPLRELVLVLQRHIWWVLTAWEPVVRELDHLSDEVRTGVREGWAVQRAAQMIAPRVHKLARVGPTDMADYPDFNDQIARALVWDPRLRRTIDHTTPAGADGVLHLMRLHSQARAMTGLTKRVRRLPGSCHECLQDDVLRQHEPSRAGDDPPVWCDDCGAWRPYEDYERLMRLVVWQDV